MGASAGGLEAFEKFLSRTPADSGMAFVLVPHLDAHHKSAMTELLQRYTSMPVVEIADRMAVEADRVHVIPPNGTLSIEKGVLRVTTPRGRSTSTSPSSRRRRATTGIGTRRAFHADNAVVTTATRASAASAMRPSW